MMDRGKIEHILRAAGRATGHKRFVVIGSAAIFLWKENVPEAMAMSREADLFADAVSADIADRISDELDSILGQASSFDAAFGYYCDGVGEETAILPKDWRDRAKAYTSPATDGVVAIVPEPNDLAVAKLCAGREKDMDWLAWALRDGVARIDTMRARFEKLPADRLSGGLGILEARLRVLAARQEP
ncbi:DUF6036 family nucleotidyltransferase [uncultured Caulobacter sp.]|uniref:DUF6036 family nucleotidyltransferase n=1 Tax=uncultured Caulobacter sp. TaxID=158749 RepID=UPI0026083BC6|nr:DUF6036 family nucleotidyltransferase [uncultured Caulobacter sp.]